MTKMSFLSNNERSAGRMSVAFNRYIYTAWCRKVSWIETEGGQEPSDLRPSRLNGPTETAYLDVNVELTTSLLLC